MSTPLTTENLKEELKHFGRELKSEIREEFREDLRQNTQEIISHFNKSQGIQNERMDKLDGRMDKLDGRMDRMEEKLEVIGDDVSKVKLAVVDLMTTDRSLRNLVRELQRNGIALKTENIFAT